ncbi:MAG: hypothetical protein HWD59_11990 [Coxiellaceae bacterium]|nr:MAG: hypothetical protein HWD59_11990 [Coxiellaceae bacterium]
MTLPDLKQFVTAGFHNVINRIKTHANDYEWKFYGSLHAYEAQGKNHGDFYS